MRGGGRLPAQHESGRLRPPCEAPAGQDGSVVDFKAVDSINVIDKEENIDPEGVYFAFPFAVPSPDFHVEIADAVMRPGKDQLPFTCYDFYSIQHWADVGNRDGGIIFAPLEAPLIVRLLEQRGQRARCTLRLMPPGGRRMQAAYAANPLEQRRKPLDVSEGSVTVELRPNEIATIGLVPAAP